VARTVTAHPAQEVSVANPPACARQEILSEHLFRKLCN
jgi:hypothetical protein